MQHRISRAKRYGGIAVLFIAFSVLQTGAAAAQDKRPDVHADFEFDSFPWSQEANETFSSENVRLLMVAFHKGWSVDKFVKETESDLIDTLTLMDRFEEENLIAGPSDYQMRPRLPVIREEDLARVEKGLSEDAAALTGILENRWTEIDEFVDTLEAAKSLPRHEVLYQVIVGGLLLGGVVDALQEDQTLMPPPPRRARGGERYYAWMVEGKAVPPIPVQQVARVGRYDVASVGPVAEENPRVQIDDVGRGGAVYESEDAARWRVFTSVFSRDHVLSYLKSRRSRLIELGGEVEASKYTAFAEFFAWYYNSAVARVTETLVESGRIDPPDTSYKYALRSGR